MRNKTDKEPIISLRLSDEEYVTWNRAWREYGYHSRSDMVRNCVNTKIMPGEQNASPKAKEDDLHLSRIAASLIELETAVSADNDNALQNSQFAEDLQAAIDHVLSLKKVS